MRMVTLPSGVKVPALGQGTWNMGDERETRAEEIAALRLGLDLGLQGRGGLAGDRRPEASQGLRRAAVAGLAGVLVGTGQKFDGLDVDFYWFLLVGHRGISLPALM